MLLCRFSWYFCRAIETFLSKSRSELISGFSNWIPTSNKTWCLILGFKMAKSSRLYGISSRLKILHISGLHEWPFSACYSNMKSASGVAAIIAYGFELVPQLWLPWEVWFPVKKQLVAWGLRLYTSAPLPSPSPKAKPPITPWHLWKMFNRFP